MSNEGLGESAQRSLAREKVLELWPRRWNSFPDKQKCEDLQIEIAMFLASSFPILPLCLFFFLN